MKKEIIGFLKESGGFISGEDISAKYNVSRAAVWKRIQELRDEGYLIKGSPHLGYKITKSPDKLLPYEIKSGLDTKLLGREILYYDTVETTMDIAFKHGLNGVLEGTIVCAESQTRGKGRMGRKWASPKGKGIYCSVILRPQLSVNETSKLTIMAAVAVCEALNSIPKVASRIKWPNDILIQDRKVAGILTELNAEMDRVHFVVFGLGVNVNSQISSLPKNAVSIKAVTGRELSRVFVLQEILRSIETRYFEAKKKGFSIVFARFKELCVTLGKRVRLVNLSDTVEGTAVDIDELGRLTIRLDNGTIVYKSSGDVVKQMQII
ncbi:MAG: biotin--[acetyl-CoA-carboxylase] ligase [Candidatus Omnitrophica bacterium]|nr:biotin--[acetyl-CoA-carboxylase] ligase [Candidatus Omnitrophota bacterium]